MKNAIILVLGCSFAAAMPSRAAAEETLCIDLYNLAAVPGSILDRATSVAGRVFMRAGISTTWEQRSADAPELHTFDLNTSLGNLPTLRNRPCLVLRLVRDLPSNEYTGALGFALPFARFGVNAEIFYHRIEFQAAFAGVDPYILLAYTTVHEIGHVLLRSSEHALAGVMQAHPGVEDWRAASLGRMAFLPGQAKQMRREVRRYRSPAHPIQEITSELARNRIPR
jgi:hypothetical protein